MNNITVDKARELTNNFFSLIPYETLILLQEKGDCNGAYYPEECYDGVVFGFGYYSDDSLIQEWIKDNADFLANTLNFIIEDYETLGYVLCIPSVGHDFYQDYFVDFWEAFYLNNVNNFEARKEFKKALDMESKDAQNLLKNINDYIGDIELSYVDEEKEIIYLNKGIEHLGKTLDKKLEVHTVEIGYELDNNWLILERKY